MKLKTLLVLSLILTSSVFTLQTTENTPTEGLLDFAAERPAEFFGTFVVGPPAVKWAGGKVVSTYNQIKEKLYYHQQASDLIPKIKDLLGADKVIRKLRSSKLDEQKGAVGEAKTAVDRMAEGKTGGFDGTIEHRQIQQDYGWGEKPGDWYKNFDESKEWKDFNPKIWRYKTNDLNRQVTRYDSALKAGEIDSYNVRIYGTGVPEGMSTLLNSKDVNWEAGLP